MGSTIISHRTDNIDLQEQKETTNLSLKSLAYNNYRSYREALDLIALNSGYTNQSITNVKRLTNSTNNLITASQMMFNVVGSALKSKGYKSEYNTIVVKWGFSAYVI